MKICKIFAFLWNNPRIWNTFYFFLILEKNYFSFIWRRTGEGLQILTYTRHPWPLSSESSLASHTQCDTGHPFIMVISENPWHSHLLPNVWQGSCHYLFYDLSLLRLEFEHRTFRMRGERSNRLRHRGGYSDYKEYIDILSVYI